MDSQGAGGGSSATHASVVCFRYGFVFVWRLIRKHFIMETNKILSADVLDLLFEDNRAPRAKVAGEVSTVLRPKL